MYSLFEDHDHLVLVVESVVQVEQLLVVQLVHQVHLVAHQVLVRRVRSVDELGDKRATSRLLDAAVHGAERATARSRRRFESITKAPQTDSGSLDAYQVKDSKSF